MSYRHFVFDLDGTLIDSRQDLADSANALLDAYGAPPLPQAEIVAMVGEGARVLVERVLVRAAVTTDVDQALETFLAAYDDRLTIHTRPYDGVPALLEALVADGCHLSVLTNKPQRASERVLEALALRQPFSTVLGGDSTYGRKPAPAGLRALIDSAGIAAAETVMVGDSWVDLRTAAAAGVDACLASYGFGALDLDPETRASARLAVDTPGAISALAHGRPPAPSTRPANRV